MEVRPKLTLPFSAVDRGLIGFATLGLVLNFALVLYYLPQIPEQVPMKFSFSGEPVAWSGRSMIWLLPALSAFIFALLLLIARVPQVHNFPWTVTERNAQGFYRLSRQLCYWILNVVLYVFLFADYFILEVATGALSGMPIWFVPLSFVAIAVPVLAFFRRGKRLAARLR
jgi:uncharacterized membrane protein